MLLEMLDRFVRQGIKRMQIPKSRLCIHRGGPHEKHFYHFAERKLGDYPSLVAVFAAAFPMVVPCFARKPTSDLNPENADLLRGFLHVERLLSPRQSSRYRQTDVHESPPRRL